MFSSEIFVSEKNVFPPAFREGVHLFTPSDTAIGSVPSLPEFINWSMVITQYLAYRWRSLPRVRRHRASKPQGSSERVLPWQITMDQLIFASLSHTHYWYEVGMLKVPEKRVKECLKLLKGKRRTISVWRFRFSCVPRNAGSRFRRGQDNQIYWTVLELE